MSTNKRTIADQVLFKIQGGYPDAASPVQYPDIYKALEQKINADFKTQHFAQTLASGDTIPEHAMIATYEDVVVTESDNGLKSEATLPVTPISLPRNMGIWNVYAQEVPYNSFIPLLPGQANLLRSQVLINELMGQVGYSPKRNTIKFEKNIIHLGVSTVTMELLVLDLSAYSDTDALPIPPDYEAGIIEYLTKLFAPVQQGDKENDAYTEVNKIKQ